MTKVYNTQEEIDADIADGVLHVEDDIQITFDCVVKGNIDAGNIDAENIDAENIDAGNIDAENIDALNINAGNINAGNINADDINADDINAWNIKAGKINARNILYYAVCFAYSSFKCKSIKGLRENSRHFCLDSEIEIIGGQND